MSSKNKMGFFKSRYRSRFYPNRIDDLPDVLPGGDVLSLIDHYFNDKDGEPRPLDSFATSPSFANISTSSRAQDVSRQKGNSPTKPDNVRESIKSQIQECRKSTRSRSEISAVPDRKLYNDEYMETNVSVQRKSTRNSSNTTKKMSKDRVYSSDNSVTQDPPSPTIVTPLIKRRSLQDSRSTDFRSTGKSASKHLMDDASVSVDVTDEEPETENEEIEDCVVMEEEGSPNMFQQITSSPAVKARASASNDLSEKFEKQTLQTNSKIVLEQSPLPGMSRQQTQNKAYEMAEGSRADCRVLDAKEENMKSPAPTHPGIQSSCRGVVELYEQQITEGKSPKTLSIEAHAPSKGMSFLDRNDGPEEDEFIICDITDSDESPLNWNWNTRKGPKKNKTEQLQKKVDVVCLSSQDSEVKQLPNASSNLGKAPEEEKAEKRTDFQNETFDIVHKKFWDKSKNSKGTSNSKQKQPSRRFRKESKSRPSKQKADNKKSEKTVKQNVLETSHKMINKQGLKQDGKTERITRSRKLFNEESESSSDSSKIMAQQDVANNKSDFTEQMDLDGFHCLRSRHPANVKTVNPQSKLPQKSKRICKKNRNSKKHKESVDITMENREATTEPPDAKRLKLREHDPFNNILKQRAYVSDDSSKSDVEEDLPNLEEHYVAQIMHPSEAGKLLDKPHQKNLARKASLENNRSTEQEPLQQDQSPLRTSEDSDQSASVSHWSFQSGPSSSAKGVQSRNSNFPPRKETTASNSDSDEDSSSAIIFDPDTRSDTLSNCIKCMNPEDHEQLQSGGIWRCFKNNIFSAGKMFIRPFKEEARTSPVFDILVFYIIKGKVDLKLHKMWYHLRSGDFFFIPPYNTFIIRNVIEDMAELVFTQLNTHV